MQTTTIRLINEAVANTLVLAAKAHFWHLTAPTLASHLALGEVYSTLHSIADELSESAQGEGFEHSPISLQTNFQIFSPSQSIGELENYCTISLNKIILGIAGSREFAWLENSIMDYQTRIYKILYRLKKLT